LPGTDNEIIVQLAAETAQLQVAWLLLDWPAHGGRQGHGDGEPAEAEARVLSPPKRLRVTATPVRPCARMTLASGAASDCTTVSEHAAVPDWQNP